jgi:hypothetical protein
MRFTRLDWRGREFVLNVGIETQPSDSLPFPGIRWLVFQEKVGISNEMSQMIFPTLCSACYAHFGRAEAKIARQSRANQEVVE